MPQRIITIFSCSLCAQESEEREWFRPATFTWDGAQYSYDICGDCAENDTALKTLLERGMSENASGVRKAKSPARAGQAFPCPQCDVVVSSERGLTQHRARAHGLVTKTAVRTAELGKRGDYVCDYPGCGFRSTMPQGKSAHMKACPHRTT